MHAACTDHSCSLDRLTREMLCTERAHRPPQNRTCRIKDKRGAGWPPSPSPLELTCRPDEEYRSLIFFRDWLSRIWDSIALPNLPRRRRRARDRPRRTLTRALEQKGEGRLVFIFRLSCLKAFTPSPPLTPLPCRIDSGCDMVEVIPRRCNAPFVRPGVGKDKAKGICAGGWLGARAPAREGSSSAGMCCSSRRAQKLMLQSSHQDSCRAPCCGSCSIFLAFPQLSQTLQSSFLTVGKRATHLFTSKS